MAHSQRQSGPGERLGDGPNVDDDNNSLSTIPREIYVRKGTDASTCKTSSTGSSGSRSSRSFKNTRGRLRFSFFAQRSKILWSAFRPSKDREGKRKRPRALVAADKEDDDQVVGDSTDSRDITPNSPNNAQEESPEAPEPPAEASLSPPPPSYDEALRLGLFSRPSQRESIETRDPYAYAF